RHAQIANNQVVAGARKPRKAFLSVKNSLDFVAFLAKDVADELRNGGLVFHYENAAGRNAARLLRGCGRRGNGLGRNGEERNLDCKSRAASRLILKGNIA